jgi:competence transcription factor ComK
MGVKERLSSATKALTNRIQNANIVQIILVVVSLTIVISIIWYISDKLSIRSRKCNYLRKEYEDFPKISSITTTNEKFGYTLKDYYIKTAYNACSVGNFKNSYVDLCALKKVIHQGYRCLDFAIYSVDNEPVIATSDIDNYNVKYTYNSVPFDAICESIANQAFTSSGCPNPNDPILIHLRVLSQNSVIYKKMAEIISNRLKDYILGKRYSYEYSGKNVGDLKLTDLQQKVVIMIDNSNPMYKSTDLNEFVNISSNSIFMRSMRYDEMRYTPDMDELTNYNKKNMSIILPNYSIKNENPSFALALKFGCQMMAMSIQNNDNNLDFYNNYFSKEGTAFVLKPVNLRYESSTVTAGKGNPDSQSFEQKDITILDGAVKFSG